jgi:SAM-dependent methyltransferase
MERQLVAMTDGWLGGDTALETNELFARVYDDFNYRYKNIQWTGRLLERAHEAGLRGDELLDVACGTGLSFIPMMRRGWKITACDISEAMLEIARRKVGDSVRLLQADMRELPVLGSFDLVWAVNDALNYLLSESEFRAALAGMKSNLGAGGVMVFDVNTLATYRTFFTETLEVKVKGRQLVWTGRMRPEAIEPGVVAEARFEAVGEQGSVHVHHQRHFPQQKVLEALKAVDLQCVEVVGVGEPEGNLLRPLDEEVHSKAVYVCTV